MGKVCLKFLVFLLAAICCSQLLAQTVRSKGSMPGSMPAGVNSQEVAQGGNGLNDPQNPTTPEGKEGAEEEKPPKIRKPLESYFFNDSIRALRNFAWNIDVYRNNLSVKNIDTMLNVFQVDYPYLKNDVGSAYLGNLGAAAVPLNYFTRPVYRNFEFAQVLDAYLFTPARVNYFNVKHPFTHLTYFTAGQKQYAEETLYATHAQNISPTSGFNIDYKTRGTKGIYNWQKARDKNLSMAFSHTGKKYTVHGGYIFNGADLRENGGVIDDWYVTDTIMELPANIPVELTDATNRMRNNTYFVVQSYGVPLKRLTDEDFSIAGRSSVYVGLATEYSRFNKVYRDTKAKSGDFYEDWFVNSTSSQDSISETLLSNRLFMQIQPWKRESVIGVIDAGAGMDMHHYYMFRLADYLQGIDKGDDRQSYYMYGSVRGQLKKYAEWNADLRIHPTGYRSGDAELGAEIALHAYSKGRPLTLSGSFRSSLRSPGYWTENYFSNHYVWSNSFAQENETRLDARFMVPHLALELGGFQALATDKIYYDATGVPAQASGSVSVSGLYASKNFRLGGLHLNNRVLLQWTTDDRVVPVPLASAFVTLFYDFSMVKDVLHIQVGVDGRYNTLYYAFGYNPAIAQFYNQREKQLGNYVMMDAFLAAKWKRMRILLKYQHVNEGLFGDRNYFQILHYPLNERVLKIGFSWAFYD